MGKVCIACGTSPEEEKKPADQPENCENCGGDETVKPEAGDKPEQDGD